MLTFYAIVSSTVASNELQAMSSPMLNSNKPLTLSVCISTDAIFVMAYTSSNLKNCGFWFEQMILN